MEEISAQVILKTSKDAGLFSEEKITSENVSSFLPNQETIAAAVQYFQSIGFKTGPSIGISFSIAGNRALFEAFFQTAIFSGNRGSLHVSKEGQYELPLSSCPKEIQEILLAITFTPPPDFPEHMISHF